MNIKYIFCTLLIVFSANQAFGWSYRQQAEYNVQLQEEAKKRAQIDAEADRLMKRDAEIIAAIFSSIGYCIRATGKFIFLGEFKDDTEIVIGAIGATAVGIASAIGLHKLYTSYKNDQNKPKNKPETTQTQSIYIIDQSC